MKGSFYGAVGAPDGIDVLPIPAKRVLDVSRRDETSKRVPTRSDFATSLGEEVIQDTHRLLRFGGMVRDLHLVAFRFGSYLCSISARAFFGMLLRGTRSNWREVNCW